MIAIVDYGVGNLFSLSSSLRFLGLSGVVTSDEKELERADQIILPGVGAFGDAMGKLCRTGLIPALNSQVKAGKPLLGICLGMQMLFERSFEYGEHNGLGYIPGVVLPLSDIFEKQRISLKVPHMGWNGLQISCPDHPIIRGTENGGFVYFVHSFYAEGCAEYTVATATYGVEIPAVVANGSVCGCQFHPEKSGSVGLNMLRRFALM